MGCATGGRTQRGARYHSPRRAEQAVATAARSRGRPLAVVEHGLRRHDRQRRRPRGEARPSDADGQGGAGEVVVAGGQPAVGAVEDVLEADAGVHAIRRAYSRTGQAPSSSPCSRIRTGRLPRARRMRMASATEVSGSDTVDSASTRVVPAGWSACAG